MIGIAQLHIVIRFIIFYTYIEYSYKENLFRLMQGLNPNKINETLSKGFRKPTNSCQLCRSM